MLWGGPTLVVLNKADLAGFGAGGPIAVADRRAGEIQVLTGVPTVPMVGLLAAATLDDELIAALRALTVEPADLTSTDGFLSAEHSLSRERAQRDCWTPSTCSASPTASSRCGRAPRPPRCLPCCVGSARSTACWRGWPWSGAEVRYRRMRSALVRLRTMAACGRPALAEFLSGDDAVIAVMAAAVDVVQGAGLTVDHDDEPSAHLHAGAALAPLQPWTCQPASPPLRRRHLPRLTEAAAACGGPVTDVDQAGDPIGAVDALVAGVDPGLSSPGVENRDVVLVTGPWLAGATGLIAALRDRLPEHEFVEAEDIRPADAPAAVVFVVSAVAPITESDCALIDLAAQHTDLVIGAVSKIDVHRNWRDVLAEDRSRLAAHAERYRDVPWVGVAAAPDLGEPTHRRARRAAAVAPRRCRCEATKQVAGVGISSANAIIAVRQGRRGRRPAGAGDRTAGTARHGPARAQDVQVRAHHRAAQPDPAGPGAAGVLRPQPLHLGAIRAARGCVIHDATSAAGVRDLRRHPGQRGGRRGGGGHHATPLRRRNRTRADRAAAASATPAADGARAAAEVPSAGDPVDDGARRRASASASRWASAGCSPDWLPA